MTRHDVVAPMAGAVVHVEVATGSAVAEGATLVVLESMKMQHPVVAPVRGRVHSIGVSVGEQAAEGQVLATIEEDATVVVDATPVLGSTTEGGIRPDLAAVLDRRARLHDDARPDAVAKRSARGRRTARANVDDLVDPDSFEEYGGLAFAAQTARRPVDELIERTPADGLITGIGRVNGDRFPDARARCAVLAYDATVLAGTQGQRNHAKKDRILELARTHRLPVVLFAEGGGGRPGDTDTPVISGLDTMAFALYARLSGLVPLVGIAAGYCFAGNAALLGCSDVVIATRDSSIGMGGPAMIEGGGLGVHAPESIGPVDVQVPNGVIDVLVDDEAEAVRVAQRYLSYFQGPLDEWEAHDQTLLRDVVPEDRLRVYDVRRALELLADVDGLLELRAGHAPGIVTALARIAGRPLGVLASNPAHLGGAIDSPAADKAARFLALCDAFDLPVLSLCDTPGFMVGPEAEADGQVRRFSRLFVTGANLEVPIITVVLRKAYGLGAQAMAGGSLRVPLATLAWPTAEFGGMGLEGAVRLGFRRELDAQPDEAARAALEAKLIAGAYERGSALNVAAHLEIDDVIDPATTRDRIVGLLRSLPPVPADRPRRHTVPSW